MQRIWPLVLSNEFISDPDWDGSGVFSADEVEDHIISLPDINGKNIVIQMSCPNRVILHANGAPAFLACNVTNMRNDPGIFRYLLNGVFRGPSVQVTPVVFAAIGVNHMPPPPRPVGQSKVAQYQLAVGLHRLLVTQCYNFLRQEN